MFFYAIMIFGKIYGKSLPRKYIKERNKTMEILYKSTRGDSTPVTASMAILKGLSEDGG